MKPDWVGDSGVSLERISAGELRDEIAPLRNGLPVAVGVHRRSAGHAGLVVFMPGARSRLAAQRAVEVNAKRRQGRRGGRHCEAERG